MEISSKNIFGFNLTLRNQKIYVALRVIGTLLILYIALITSWISDDAQITFRQILNFLSGDGIVFNFGERVQAFTHPLWFFLLSGVIAFTSEIFLTTSIVSIILSLTAIIILLRMEFNLGNTKLTYITPIYFLIFSFAFCDYMTSGLENPLSYLLTSLLLYLLFQENIRKNLQLIYIILALLVLNRFDYVVLFFPLALVLVLSYTSKSELIKVLLPGSVLIIAWIIFATVYFGSPLPNTYYAKLNAGYPRSEIFERGIDYLISLKFDIVSILIISISFLSIFLYRDRILLSLAVGKVLYLCYVVYIGGDFMIGRYIAILVLLSIGEIIVVLKKSLISVSIKNYVLMTLLLVCLIIGLIYDNPITSFKHYRNTFFTENGWRVFYKATNDQRGSYYKYTGLFAKYRDRWPNPEKFKDGPPQKYRIVCGWIGAIALTDVSKYHIDPCGLTDPFIARLPAIDHENWFIGHHFRKIPTEYGQYKIGKISELPDTELNELLKDVTLLAQGDIFSLRRFGAIWRMFINTYSNLNFEKYIDPRIWIPLTNSSDSLKIENWNTEIPHDDHPYYLKYKQQFSFNNNLIVESQVPQWSSIVWVYLNLRFTYDLYVNNKKIYTLDKYRQDCSNGVRINLNHEHLINTIEIKATDEIEDIHLPFNFLRFLRIRESDDKLEFMPHCIVNL